MDGWAEGEESSSTGAVTGVTTCPEASSFFFRLSNPGDSLPSLCSCRLSASPVEFPLGVPSAVCWLSLPLLAAPRAGCDDNPEDTTMLLPLLLSTYESVLCLLLLLLLPTELSVLYLRVCLESGISPLPVADMTTQCSGSAADMHRGEGGGGVSRVQQYIVRVDVPSSS